MFFPSNDGFIANDDPIEIFDSQGNFIGADFIVSGNQVLDALDGFFANGDFKADGFQVARITISRVPEPATTTGLLALGGLFLLRCQVRRK